MEYDDFYENQQDEVVDEARKRGCIKQYEKPNQSHPKAML